MKNFRPAIIGLFLINSIIAFSQYKKLDSLRRVFAQSKEDSTRLRTLLKMSEASIFDAPDSSIAFAKQIIVRVNENLKAGKHPKDLLLFYYNLLGHANNRIGLIVDKRGDSYTAEEYYLKAAESWKKADNALGAGAVMNNMGFINLNQGNVNKALSYFEGSLKLHEGIIQSNKTELMRDAKRGVATAYLNMGMLFGNLKMFEDAANYVNKALPIYQSIQDYGGVFNAYASLGGAYSMANKPDSAFKYFNLSLDLSRTHPNKTNEAVSLSSLGYLFETQNDFNKALDYFDRALQLKQELNDLPGISHNYYAKARIYYQMRNLDQAFLYANKSYSLALTIKSPKRILAASKILKDVYQDRNNYKEAYAMYEVYVNMRDSMNNEEARKAGIKSQLKHEYEKKAAADSVKAAEEKKVVNAQLKQEKTQRLALYGGLGLVGIFALFMVNRFRVTNKQKKVIEEQKKTVEAQKHLVEEKQKEIIDSITYARRIQTALITNEHYIKQNLLRLKK